MVKTKRTGGARQNAGRKGFSEENIARELIRLGATECIKALKKEGEYADLSMEVRLDIACKFAVKAIPQKIEGENLEIRQIVQVYLPSLADANKHNTLEASSGAARNLSLTNGS